MLIITFSGRVILMGELTTAVLIAATTSKYKREKYIRRETEMRTFVIYVLGVLGNEVCR
jgi:hypothetical protein